MYENTQCVNCLCLASFNLITLVFILFLSYSRHPLLLLTTNILNLLYSLCQSLGLHLCVDGRLGCFQFGVVSDKTSWTKVCSSEKITSRDIPCPLPCLKQSPVHCYVLYDSLLQASRGHTALVSHLTVGKLRLWVFTISSGFTSMCSPSKHITYSASSLVPCI